MLGKVEGGYIRDEPNYKVREKHVHSALTYVDFTVQNICEQSVIIQLDKVPSMEHRSVTSVACH